MNDAGAHKTLYRAPVLSIAVGVRLEGALHAHANVVSLLLAQRRELRAQGRQEIYLVLVAFVLLPILQDVQLPQDLVREGAGHHEGGVARGAAQVQQSPRREDDDAVAIREDEAINLRLDVLHLNAREVLQLVHLDLVVKVTDVADNGVVLHLLHVLQGNDVEVPGGRGENVDLSDNRLQRDHLEALHASLQGADRIAL